MKTVVVIFACDTTAQKNWFDFFASDDAAYFTPQHIECLKFVYATPLMKILRAHGVPMKRANNLKPIVTFQNVALEIKADDSLLMALILGCDNLYLFDKSTCKRINT